MKNHIFCQQSIFCQFLLKNQFLCQKSNFLLEKRKFLSQTEFLYSIQNRNFASHEIFGQISTQDYAEYNSCTGEWELPSEIILPENPITKRMYKILNQTILPPQTNQEFSDDKNWPLRIAILGKRFAGLICISKFVKISSFRQN